MLTVTKGRTAAAAAQDAIAAWAEGNGWTLHHNGQEYRTLGADGRLLRLAFRTLAVRFELAYSTGGRKQWLPLASCYYSAVTLHPDGRLIVSRTDVGERQQRAAFTVALAPRLEGRL
jgi:hypothetical protein